MPLIKVPFKPGFNKQLTKTTAEYQWTDGDFVRFRYGEPEKMGGWTQPLANTLPGVARDIHNWSALDGTKYIGIGTTKGLFLYFEGAFYDISPLGTALTSCTFTTTNGSATVTVNKTSHNLTVGEYVVFTSVTLPGSGTGFATADFTTNPFEIITVPNANSFTITMSAVESGAGITAAGSATTTPYEEIGPTVQTQGFGWSTGTWSGSQNWGEASTTSTTTLEPGNWSLDNYGQILIATIRNGKSFEWDPSASNALTTRATAVATNPTSSVHTIVSDTDRHLIHLGTETTIGTPASQDKMFIRFSDQEDRTTYAPTSTNTAGTFQLDSGSKIVGAVRAKDLTFIVTDTSAYIMQFVGPPFTFSIRQVGTNCGAMSQHSIIHVDGVVYWMGRSGGFFVYDGAGVKKISCSVEDFVFTTQTSDDLGFNFNQNEIVFAGFNGLFTEINWFYPKAGSDVIDRCVTLNYREGVWTTSSLDRTTYVDKFTFDNPYATQYSSTATPNFSINGITNTYGATTLYEHEVGTNQVDSAGSKTAIPAFIESGDFSLDMEGAQGEFFLKIRRFIPDFAKIDGNAKVSLLLKDFPAETESSSSLGPFTVTASTNKIDTRARGRFAALKIENESTDETWRFGSFRADVQPDGRR
tara:strand:+ start:749 stop:2668 length:1920 start_codon:yes stop_codon:yes gene_type:complete